MTPRVLILARALHPLHPPGGMERAIYEQARHLIALGAPLTIVAQWPTTSPTGTDEIEAACPALAGVNWRFVRYGDLPLRRNSVPDRLVNYPLFVRRVGENLRGNGLTQAHVIHAHGLLAAAAPGDRPLVYAPHGLEEFSRSSARKWLAYAPIRLALRRAARRAAVVLATDARMAPLVGQALRVPAERIEIVPNGVSLAWLDSLRDEATMKGIRARLDIERATLRLVTCARLERNKGLHVALEALAACQRDLPAGWGWWIVGLGREEAALRAQISAAGLAGHVHLLGGLSDSDLHNLLPQMDLYLMPSLYEGSSIATLEAMAHRLPTLATAVGGLPDKVVPGRTGYLATPDVSGALAVTLRQALADRASWPAMGAAGRALVEERFDWPAIARQLMALYERLLDGTTYRGKR